jgi:Na+/H+-translocating membrane pyrophosphatase
LFLILLFFFPFTSLFPNTLGTFFGVYAVFGLLTGGLVSGVQLAISMSNTGGAWDNAKKYIEQKLSDDPALRGKVGAMLVATEQLCLK